MTLHAHQRDASLHAGGTVHGWTLAMLVACLLLPCAAFAQDAKQDAASPREPVVQSPPGSPVPNPEPASIPGDAVPENASLRGVSAPAALDAVPTQAETPQATTPVVPAPPVPVAADPADAPASAKPVLLADGVRVRGVLFRITPPTPAGLPAEVAGGDSPAVPAPVEPNTEAPAALPAAAAPSYILGTIHFGTPEEQGIDYAALEKLAASTDTFVNEADMDEAWKPDYDHFRWLPVEQPLSGLIGAERLATAHALLPAIRQADLERMKPWSVLALLEARGERSGDAGMDARLQRIAGAAGKRMVHLETLEQQLQALDCVPAAEHAIVLDQRLQKSWILRIESAEAMAHYRARNLEAWLSSIDRLEGLDDAAKAVEQRSRRCLLEERNARWIGQLETLFQDGTSFVAVGAVHLVGPDGLLAALRRDGYRVEALPL